jgi:hypothetical protein
MIRRILIAITSVVLVGVPVFAQPAPPTQLDGFVPLDQLPPGEQMPAAPLLIAAYAFFLVLMMVYLWTIWNRLSKVEKEMHELQRRQGGTAR